MIQEIPTHNLKYLLKTPQGGTAPKDFSDNIAQKVLAFHSKLPSYRPTSLVRLDELARAWGLRDVFVKDESTRFKLKAFKVLGGSYAVARLMCEKLGKKVEDVDFDYLKSEEVRKQIGQITLASATDGNHGRGIAWAAEKLGQKVVIYMPKGVAESRVENIKGHGATVEVTDLNYDDAVRLCCEKANENGWHVVQDTAWEGYRDIPRWIMQGYMTMCAEAVDQMVQRRTLPSHVFIQAGVGALAGAVMGYLINRFQDNPPKFIIMEPGSAACVFTSAAAGDGKTHAVRGDHETIMAGLACGEVNPLSWDILRDFTDCYVSCENHVAANGMRILANPLAGDAAVEAGESGSVGIGLLDLIANNGDFEELKKALEIDADSTALIFNTEGSTDPVNYQDILWHGKYPSL